MASWTDDVFNKNKSIRDNFISDGYNNVVSTFTNIGVPEFTYRDLYWNGSDIYLKSSMIPQGSFTPSMKLKYYEQLRQLLDIGTLKNLYP